MVQIELLVAFLIQHRSDFFFLRTAFGQNQDGAVMFMRQYLPDNELPLGLSSCPRVEAFLKRTFLPMKSKSEDLQVANNFQYSLNI